MIAGSISGIANITLEGDQLVFHFNDGSSTSMTIPLPKDGDPGKNGDPGEDGLSITDIEINENNHLICTLSDSSTIDAGELPKGEDGVSVVNIEINESNHLICTLSDDSTIDAGELLSGIGGGLVQVDEFSDLESPGKDNVIYLVLEDKTLYYWDSQDNEYKTLITTDGSSEEPIPIDFKTDGISFDGEETTFDLPVDDKTVNIYINGMYLTEDEDYTIDRGITPNQVTFLETWNDTDICTITWIEGTGSSGSGDGDIKITLATREDIDKMFSK